MVQRNWLDKIKLHMNIIKKLDPLYKMNFNVILLFKTIKNRKFLFLLLVNLFMNFGFCFALTEEARTKGFVYLHEIDPTIIISLRYNSSENFLGTCVDSYKKPVLIITEQAAMALKEVQTAVKKDGYSLVVYDAYRPQQAVNHFMRWSKDPKEQSKKPQYYPRIDKAKVFELGYVAEKSAHSRGSTVDVTLIKLKNC